VRTRFLIVGTYRCGTSALVEAVGRHPDILCGMEWTHHVSAWNKIGAARRALAGDFSALPERQRQRLAAVTADRFGAVGFKLLFRSSNKWLLHPRWAPALAVDRFSAHLRWLRRDSDVRIVHVVRQDNIAWLRSKTLSDATGSYSGTRYPDELRLSISVGVAKRRVQAKIWIDAELETLSATNPYFRIIYEEFVAQNLAVPRKIVEFLGCDPELLPATELRHQLQSRASRATIVNSDELRDALGPLAHLRADA
jgi:hypothetical protein